MQKFYSNGKLLISGEYLILDGAAGLALPSVFGQDLLVKTVNQNNTLSWNSLDENDAIWFEANFSLPELTLIDVNGDKKVADTLVKILQEAKKSNSKFLNDSKGLQVTTKLFFPRDWGLGSSSTLINNIAQWAGIDAFELLFKSFGGSGYDIACAQNNQSIIYQLKQGVPSVEKVAFNPSFKDELYFVHLNKKQVSSESIKAYKTTELDLKAVDKITDISKKIVSAHTISDFNNYLKEHENLLSLVLNQPTVQQRFFSDFKGQTKSLGAWGGDFILATGDETTIDYFKLKGYHTVIPYTSMIKTR